MACRSVLTRRAAFALFALAASPAFASSAKKDGEAPPADPTVDLLPMGLPIIVDKRLVNYVFVGVRLTLAAQVPVTVLDGKEPLLRDAVIRQAHTAPFVRPDSYVLIDEARLKAAVMRQAASLLGPGKVVGVTIVKQTPKRRLPPPTPAKT